MNNETPEVQEGPIQQDQPEPAGMFMIETTEQFAHLMEQWHANTVETIKHLMDVPTGMEVVIADEEPFKMEGDIQKGYKLGLSVALNYFGVLPFSGVPEPDESQPN